MSFKNWVLKKLVRLVRPAIALHPDRQRILVVATTALGDTLWATPALESLRACFPRAYLAVLTSPIGLEIFKGNPWVDRLYLLRKPSLRNCLWRALYRERFDTILLFHASQRFVLPLCCLLGARRIVGTVGHQKGLDSLLTDPLPNVAQHEITRRLAMVERIGGRVVSETLSLFLEPEVSLPAGRWVALHPGSKDGFKRWPAESFIQVGRKLREHCNILITGTEKDLVREIQEQIPGAVVAPEGSFRSFASLLAQVDLLISNDTGPVHIACALRRPVIALYAPTDPAICGPHLAKEAVTIFKKPTCTPCLKRKCRRPFCLLQITPEEVLEAAKKIFMEKGKIQ